MSSQKTEHLGLHAWEPADSFLRSEFNENFSAIDAALAEVLGVAEGRTLIAVGSYSGGNEEEWVIQVGFTPVCVILVNHQWRLFYASERDAISGGVFFRDTDIPQFKIVEGGFWVSGRTNTPEPFHYIAFR